MLIYTILKPCHKSSPKKITNHILLGAMVAIVMGAEAAPHPLKAWRCKVKGCFSMGPPTDEIIFFRGVHRRKTTNQNSVV